MKTETAKQAAELLAKIDYVEKKIDLLNKTKEFCSIMISGENGAEKSYRLNLNHQDDYELTESMRNHIEIYLYRKLSELNNQLYKL